MDSGVGIDYGNWGQAGWRGANGQKIGTTVTV